MADTPLGRTIATTATDLWNDSYSIPELEYAISYGAVGATANPSIVVDVWKQEPAAERAVEHASATEMDLAWEGVGEMSGRAAPLLLPAFEATRGRQGRLSVQTSPTVFRSPEGMIAQSEGLARLAPNIIVKLPATTAGVAAIEKATARGIRVNVTPAFTLISDPGRGRRDRPHDAAVAGGVVTGCDSGRPPKPGDVASRTAPRRTRPPSIPTPR